MLIGGFQKFSLLDYPGKISSIIFTRGCNFDCIYCHNRELIGQNGPLVPPGTIISFLEERRQKLDAVVISGGEPTLQPDLTEFMKKIKKLGFLVKLDTNGYKPDVLRKVLKAKAVDYIAMDVKASPSRYRLAANVCVSPEIIRESINIIKNSGIRHEFRTTVLKSLLSVRDLEEIKKLTGNSELVLQKCNCPEQENYSEDEFVSFQKSLQCGLR